MEQTESAQSLGTGTEDEVDRALLRRIVFMQPDRMVYPPSWLEHIPFAFWLIDVLKPRVFVELGTHSGNSYAAFAQAVQHLGLDAAGYAIDTWKGDSQAGFYDESVFIEWKAYHDERYAAFSTLVRSTFDDALVHFPDGGVDLLNLDGYHTVDAVTHDFSTWLPKMSARGVVLLHDINVREGDFGAWRAWEQLRAEYPGFAFLHGHGLGVLAVGTDLPPAIVSLLRCHTVASGRAVTIRQFFAEAGAAVLSRYRAMAAERESAARAVAAQTTAVAAQATHEARVIALRTELERVTASAASVAADKGRAEERTAWLQEEIGRRGPYLEQIERARAELQRLLHDVQASFQALEARAAEAHGQLEAGARRTASLDAGRSAIEHGLRLREQRAAALEASRDRLQRELDEMRQASAARAQDMSALVAELGVMRGSYSWRLTSPLRGSRRLADKLLRLISGGR